VLHPGFVETLATILQPGYFYQRSASELEELGFLV